MYGLFSTVGLNELNLGCYPINFSNLYIISVLCAQCSTGDTFDAGGSMLSAQGYLAHKKQPTPLGAP